MPVRKGRREGGVGARYCPIVCVACLNRRGFNVSVYLPAGILGVTPNYSP